MMDQAKAFDPEEMVPCPYEKVHTFPRKRMIVHLRRCRLAFPELANQMVDCPFNLSHRIAKIEYDFHLQVCPDRETFYAHTYNVGDIPSATQDALRNTEVELNIQPTESWDIDDSGPAPDVIGAVLASADERGILQNYQNITKSERRARREEDRERIRIRENAEDRARLNPSQMYSSSNTPSQSVVNSRSSAHETTRSSASSVLSDASFNTALNVTANRLQEINLNPEKKPRGRAAKLSASMASSSSSGVGRGSPR